MKIFWRFFTDFPFTLLLSEVVFALCAGKKPVRMWLSVFTALSFCAIYSFISEAAYSAGPVVHAVETSRLLLPLINVYGLLWLYLFWNCSLKDALFLSVCAYAVQNIQYTLYYNAMIFFYDHLGIRLEGVLNTLVQYSGILIIYGAAFLVFRKILRGANMSGTSRNRIISYALLLLLMTCFFIPDYEPVLSVSRILNTIYYIAFDIIILTALVGLVNEGRQSLELEVMEQLLHQEEQQHRISRENIEIINMKCHDLKHMVRDFRRKEPESSEDTLREIENAISIYDSGVRTGSDALDTILMEKQLYCRKYAIEMGCIADGASLSFMSDSDVYSLFGNILDNAIESVLAVPDEECRVISMNIGTRGGMVRIHQENYMEGTLRLKSDGLPETTKSDRRYHGFGVMSIRHIVNKYGGELSIDASGNMFQLNIFIPMPEKMNK